MRNRDNRGEKEKEKEKDRVEKVKKENERRDELIDFFRCVLPSKLTRRKSPASVSTPCSRSTVLLSRYPPG
jgi:hypothetical protein